MSQLIFALTAHYDLKICNNVAKVLKMGPYDHVNIGILPHDAAK
jgi:hypothetical protein